jgi:hypothetical protein
LFARVKFSAGVARIHGPFACSWLCLSKLAPDHGAGFVENPLVTGRCCCEDGLGLAVGAPLKTHVAAVGEGNGWVDSGAPAFIDCCQDVRGSERVHDRHPLRTSIGVVGSPNFSITVATKAAASPDSQPQ